MFALVVALGLGCARTASPGSQASALFEVDPVRATVVVDGAPLATVEPGTPARIALSPGSHQIAVEAEGYETWRQDVRLRGGEVYEISVQLWPELEIPN